MFELIGYAIGYLVGLVLLYEFIGKPILSRLRAVVGGENE